MANKPAARPRWGTDLSNDTAPSSGQQDTGYTVDQIPTSGVANWLQRRVGEWIDYFADMIWRDSPEAIGFRTTVFTDWTEADPFNIGDIVRVPYRGFANDDTGAGLVYQCITGGTSGGGAGGTDGPPHGTGTDIVDGTVHWKYLGHDGYRHGDQEIVGFGPASFSSIAPVIEPFAFDLGDLIENTGGSGLNNTPGTGGCVLGAAGVAWFKLPPRLTTDTLQQIVVWAHDADATGTMRVHSYDETGITTPVSSILGIGSGGLAPITLAITAPGAAAGRMYMLNVQAGTDIRLSKGEATFAPSLTAKAALDLQPGDVLTTVRWMYNRAGVGSMQFGLARKMNTPGGIVETIATEANVVAGTGEAIVFTTHNHTIKAGYNYWLYAIASNPGQALTGCSPRFTRPAP